MGVNTQKSHATANGTHCIGGWVSGRPGVAISEKKYFFSLPGMELRLLGTLPSV
jgi:hypothetical protein